MPRTSAGRDARGVPRADRILVMAALPQEVRPFLRRQPARVRRDLGWRAWEWDPGAGLAVVSGMGGAAARQCGEALVKRCRPEILISLGFGGALAPGLAAGDLVLGATFWNYDPVTRELTAGARPAPPRSLLALRRALQSAGLTVSLASQVTTPCIIQKRGHRLPLSGLAHPVLDLESGVLAEIASTRGLAFLGLRAITDGSTDEIPEFLRGVGHQEAPVGAKQALGWLAGDVRRLADLLRLWRQSRRAARNLALALEVLWPLLLLAGDELEGQQGQKGYVNEDVHPA
jgi:adenosylhomocysteine nucleosidase